MDAPVVAVEMSSLCVPRKRKSVQLRSGAVFSDGAQPCEVTTRQDSKDERPSAGAPTRPGRDKRYEDLQGVSIATVPYATTSCAVMSPSTELTSKAPPTTGTEITWPQEATLGHQDPDWSPPRGGVEPPWVCGDDREGSHAHNHSWSNCDHSRGNIWRPDMNMKKVHRVQGEGHHAHVDGPRPPGGVARELACGAQRSGPVRPAVPSVFGPPGSEAAGPTSTGGHGGQRPPLIVLAKKAPPTFPPGSEEERWQLQITGRGRATCPKCRSVSRKTVDGLKKHMENCRLQPFTCPHCGKQLRSSTGMKYHIMADHSHLPSTDVDDRATKDKLRKVLKRLGKLKCSNQGCGAAFTSIMGYVYHMRKCGKEQSELEKMLLSCSHCTKTYRSKAGLDYHLKSEHAPTPRPPGDESPKNGEESEAEGTSSGRVQRASAQVANFHLAEIANNELPKDWPKRKFQSDLVPDDKKLKYARPGLPAFSQDVLRKWKNEVKLHRKVHCPNQGCPCTYTSVSGLKAHLGLCTKGDFQVGTYRCLICGREFQSESGVKYHITSVHSEEWFVTNKKASKKFEKFLRTQREMDLHLHHLHHHHHHHLHHPHLHPAPPAGDSHVLQFTPLTVWAEPQQEEDSPGPEQAPIDGDVLEDDDVQQM